MHATPSPRDLAAARKGFLNSGTLPEGLVPATILRSWQRCAASGLDMARPAAPEPLTAPELRERYERNEKLRQLSRPELSSLRTDARSTDSVVILTDATGLILDTSGSPDFAAQAARVSLQPGVLWNESHSGTNAIGTALVERRPVEVLGGEHFFEPHRFLSCAASPILDPFGRLAGVLDMSGHSTIHHVHALGLVRMAAEQIEHRYFNSGFENCTLVRFHKAGAYLGTPREAVLVFEDGRLVAANRRALAALSLDHDALGALDAETLFEALDPRQTRQKLVTHAGEKFVARLTPPRSARPVSIPPRAPTPAPTRSLAPIYDAPLKAAREKATRLVNADIPLLISGETGTGKEVFARAVHIACQRQSKPFIAINCAAIPESLIEAELFGYEDGAFTGARRKGQKGLIAQADGGILFLDEIGDMPLSLQSRLLRVLQDRAVTPLGGGTPIPVDFAIICATHQPLKARVDSGQFRADLYFRIAQYAVALPPLRDHPALEKLIKTLWQQITTPHTPPITPPALAALTACPWPGNYRQLTGALRAAAALIAPGAPLDTPLLSPEILTPSPPPSGPTSLSTLTESAMRAAVTEANGNISAAARTLGINRSTLYRRILASEG